MRFICLVSFLSMVLPLQAQTVDSIPFIWHDSNLNGVQFEKTSMHIPIRFGHDTTTYYFQFDTGSSRSFLYIKDNPDRILIEHCTGGDHILSDIGPLLLVPLTSNRAYTKNGRICIGTIGADFLTNKVIEINFPKQQINIIDAYNLTDYELISSFHRGNFPTITTQIRGKTYVFLFDTGSSLFELWTSKRYWKKWKGTKAEVQEYPIQSWGKINMALRAPLDPPITISSKYSLELTQVWYNTNRNFWRAFKRARLFGIIGNKPFLDETVLIDVYKNRLGIKA
ncbi:MAG: hypothetical protein HRU40_02350 [Saprospiraceae bacterium]|nr:hypothetical protein [Saprospiraceae bacterium]